MSSLVSPPLGPVKLAVKVRDGSRASRAAESATERCGDSTRIDPPGTVAAVAAETATLSEVTTEIERNRVVSRGRYPPRHHDLLVTESMSSRWCSPSCRVFCASHKTVRSFGAG